MTHERPNQSWRSNAWSAAIATILAVLLTHLFDVKAINAANSVALHDQAETIKSLQVIAKENGEARVRVTAEMAALKDANQLDHQHIEQLIANVQTELENHENVDAARHTPKRRLNP